METAGDHYAQRSEPDPKRQISSVSFVVVNRQTGHKNYLMYMSETDISGFDYCLKPLSIFLLNVLLYSLFSGSLSL